MHLCVSAKDEMVYNSACVRVEQLLDSIYLEYAEFRRRQGQEQLLTVKKTIVGGQLEDFPSTQPAIYESQTHYDAAMDENFRISPQKISELL